MTKFTDTIVPEAGLASAKVACEGGDGTKGYYVYRRGVWTPVFTFATPGNLSITYSRQIGTYIRIGDLVKLDFGIISSAFTHTTASGAVSLTGLPFTAKTIANDVAYGAVSWGGITKANYTHLLPFIASAGTSVGFVMSGSAQAASTLVAADTPTAGQIVLLGSISYEAASL